MKVHTVPPIALRIIAYALPPLAYGSFACLTTHLSDARPLYWLTPISLFLSGAALWFGYTKHPREFWMISLLVGAISFFGGLVTSIVGIAFNSWMRGS
jgi:hypothetical protein